MTGFLLLALAAVVLATGADLFTENAATLGRRVGVSALAIGVVLAGAEPEEIVTAAIASARGRPGLGVGDAVGASFTVLTLVLGIGALTVGLTVDRRLTVATLVASTASAAALAVLADGRVGRPEAALLVALYLPAVTVIWRSERLRQPRDPPPPEPTASTAPGPTSRGVATALVGIGLMTLGGWVAVAGAERVAAWLPGDDTAIGQTLLALATTAELVALVWAARRHDRTDLVVAGIVGSVVCNSTMTLGVAGLIQPVDTPSLRPMAAAVLVGSLALVGLSLRPARLGRRAGLVLVAGYLLAIVVVLTPEARSWASGLASLPTGR